MKHFSPARLALTILMILIGVSAFADQARAESPFWKYRPLNILEQSQKVAALDWHDGGLYIAAGTLEKNDLMRYDPASGRSKLILKQWPNISALAVSGDQALIAGWEPAETDDQTPALRVYFAWADLTAGEVLDKIYLDLNCFKCFAYDLEKMDGRRFAASIPGQNKVIFLAVDDQNRLRLEGEVSGLREAKGLCWHEGRLYVGGSARVDHQTRGAVYVVGDDFSVAESFKVMESRGALNSLGIRDNRLIAVNFHNYKLMSNSVLVIDLPTQKVIAEITDLPRTTARFCFRDGRAFSADFANHEITEMEFNFQDQ